ncbi:MAG: hypothetical protein D3905_13685 [Candidatus Electrothrix sp. AS4_5]|nr:hypothetical protein [Candidatus Electrothrix gigas]
MKNCSIHGGFSFSPTNSLNDLDDLVVLDRFIFSRRKIDLTRLVMWSKEVICRIRFYRSTKHLSKTAKRDIKTAEARKKDYFRRDCKEWG